MAGFNPTIGGLNATSVIPVGECKWVFGAIGFTAGDTYAAGGFDPRALIRIRFGVSDVLAILFLGLASITTVTNGSAVLARYDYTTGKVRLFQVGRQTNSTNGPPSETEISNGNVIFGLVLNFWAICQGEGKSSDAKGANN